MAAKRSKKDFLSFILAAQTKEQLATGFFLKKTAKDLFKFFQDSGFTDIKQPDCRDILKARNLMQRREVQIPARGKDPCGGRVGPRAGY
jgi:hypothetical protein